MYSYVEKESTYSVQKENYLLTSPLSFTNFSAEELSLDLQQELSALMCSLQTKLDRYTEKNSSQAQELSALLERLQNIFLDVLFTLFQQKNINTDKKLTISLNSNRLLYTIREHPDKAAIEDVFANHPYLSELFTAMSLCSLFIHHLTSMSNLAKSSRSKPVDTNKYTYQLSIKGEMSHFFIVYPF